MKKKLLVLLSCLILPQMLNAQFFNFGINFNMVSPRDDFKESLDRLGFGIAGDLAFRLGQTPLRAGAGLGFAIYGSDTREEPFSTTIPDVNVDVTTTNNILFGHLLLQYKPFSGPLQPYAEGLWGFNYLFTETEIKSQEYDWDDDDDDDDNTITSSKNLSDFTSSYGWGGGLLIRLINNLDVDSDNGHAGKGALYLDLKVRVLDGGEAEYLKEGSISRQGTNVVYDKLRSKTQMTTYHVGIVLEF